MIGWKKRASRRLGGFALEGRPAVTSPPEERSPTAIAASWVSRLTTIALGMVLPGLAGYWLDTKLGTKVVFTIIGFALGFTLGMWQLLRLTQADERTTSDGRGKQK